MSLSASPFLLTCSSPFQTSPLRKGCLFRLLSLFLLPSLFFLILYLPLSDFPRRTDSFPSSFSLLSHPFSRLPSSHSLYPSSRLPVEDGLTSSFCPLLSLLFFFHLILCLPLSRLPAEDGLTFPSSFSLSPHFCCLPSSHFLSPPFRLPAEDRLTDILVFFLSSSFISCAVSPFQTSCGGWAGAAPFDLCPRGRPVFGSAGSLLRLRHPPQSPRQPSSSHPNSARPQFRARLHPIHGRGKGKVGMIMLGTHGGRPRWNTGQPLCVRKPRPHMSRLF